MGTECENVSMRKRDARCIGAGLLQLEVKCSKSLMKLCPTNITGGNKYVLMHSKEGRALDKLKTIRHQPWPTTGHKDLENVSIKILLQTY